MIQGEGLGTKLSSGAGRPFSEQVGLQVGRRVRVGVRRSVLVEGKLWGQAGMFGVCLRKGRSLGKWLEQGFYGAVRVGGEGASGQILEVLEI